MSARDRRALTVGIGTIAFAIVAFRLGPAAVRSATDERERLRSSRALLEKARSELRAASRFEDSAAVIRRSLDSLASRILSGDSNAEAWSDLENRLSLAATRNGAALKVSTRLPDSARVGLLRRITGRAEIESDLRGVLAALRAIEHNPAVLRLGEFRLVAANPDVPSGGPEVLRAEFVVEGWFLSSTKRSDER